MQSPLPGVFYRQSAPDEPAYVEEGDEVSAGQTIGMIEIMKQFVEVKAGVAGRLTKFLAGNNAALGPGDPVATIHED